ncbi:MAG: DUF1844 domain-containing protein [Candidatus Aminicenantes bacterium]|nr:DUF1844 domain-containing protein [Candidatus Aminicenantes bacterium]
MTEKDKSKKKDFEKKKVKEKKEEEEKKKKTEKPQEEKILLPPLDFSSLVLPFFTQALLQLAQLEEKESGNTQDKLELVKRLIDLLDLLKSRTSGNLKHEEEIFLNQALHQLRMAYMEKAKIIAL